MTEARDIRNRRFSFGAQGYSQDDVDRFLHDLADRIEAPGCDWGLEAERLAGQTFRPVTLGYWRPEVDSYMVELHAMMARRAAEPVDADTPAAEEPVSAPGEPMPSGWTQTIIERLRRVAEGPPVSDTVAALGDQPAAEPEQAAVPEPPEPTAAGVPDVLTAGPREAAWTAPPGPHPPVEGTSVEEIAGEKRARLFGMAMALGIEDAVSMTYEELAGAIERARPGPAGEAAPAGPADIPEPAGLERSAQAVTAALERTKTTLDAFERMLAGEIAQLTAAAGRQRDEAKRMCEELLSDADRRAREIVADAEREREAIEGRARRYSARVRRLADRDVLRRTGAAEEGPAPAEAAESAAPPASEG